MSGRHLAFIVPGSLERRTGGSIYDRRMVDGLRGLGWMVRVTELAGVFPDADARAREDLADALGKAPDEALVVVDFLALAGLPDVLRAHTDRLRLVALVHMLPADQPALRPEERDRRRVLQHEALAPCVGVIATSSFTAARLVELGLADARIRTVIPGTERAAAAVGPGRTAPPRILCLASVTPGKGQDVLVRALERLADLSWSCVIAGSLTGSPAFVADLVASIRAAGLSDRVTLAGECDEAGVDALYRASSLFVLPSSFESYGMVLTEAMARGLPIISTTAGAIAETVPAAAGILVAPDDSVALADALRSLLRDPPDAPGRARRLRTRMGAAARRHASSLPDWDRQVGRFSESLTAIGNATP